MIHDDLLQVLLGQLPVEEFVSPLSASLMYFVITMTTGWLVRTVNKAVVPEPIQQHIADFSATLEMCAYFFENNFIYKNYGSVWLFIAVMIECFIANRTFYGASENPCQPFTACLEKKMSVPVAMIKIGIQTLAGLASYHFAKMVWALDMVPDHRERYLETACASDLNTTLLVGFLIEMGATLIDTWLGRQTVAKQSVLDEIIKLANGSFMIVLGINMTGMYFNPAMASGHTFGCHGTVAWEHFFVYWIGPFLGCLAAIILDQTVHVDVVVMEKDKKKKKE